MIQKYPFLVNSITRNGEEKRKDIERGEKNYKRHDARFSVRNGIVSGIETALEKSNSTAQFISNLKECGYAAYYRSGKLTGVKDEQNGMKFRFARLGFNIDTLLQKGLEKKHELSQLSELQNLRQGRERTIRQFPQPERENHIENEMHSMSTEKDNAELEAIQKLRGGEEIEPGQDVNENGNKLNTADQIPANDPRHLRKQVVARERGEDE